MSAVEVRPRGPLLVPVGTVGLICGGLGAAYPGTLLAEPVPPSLLGGVLLGIIGACALSFTWAVPLGAVTSAGDDPASVRAARFTHGTPQSRVRTLELLSLFLSVLVALLAGAIGGLISVLAQDARGGHHLFWGTHLAPHGRALMLALAVVVVATVLGWLLGLGCGSTSSAVLMYIGALTGSALLAGASYFSPGIAWVTALSPAAVLLLGLRGQLLAPQFTENLPAHLVTSTAVVWALLLLIVAARRIRSRVR